MLKRLQVKRLRIIGLHICEAATWGYSLITISTSKGNFEAENLPKLWVKHYSIDVHLSVRGYKSTQGSTKPRTVEERG